jgi:hypothetical protein
MSRLFANSDTLKKVEANEKSLTSVFFVSDNFNQVLDVT